MLSTKGIIRNICDLPTESEFEIPNRRWLKSTEFSISIFHTVGLRHLVFFWTLDQYCILIVRNRKKKHKVSYLRTREKNLHEFNEYRRTNQLWYYLYTEQSIVKKIRGRNQNWIIDRSLWLRWVFKYQTKCLP